MESSAPNVISLPLPTHSTLPDSPDAVDVPVRDSVEPLGDEREATIQTLRQQIVLLTNHYVEDACRFQRRLQSARVMNHNEKTAHRETANSLASTRAKLEETEASLRLYETLLEEERAECARMTEIARVPWWAVGRKRWALRLLAKQQEQEQRTNAK